jgi:hypothetical protein
MKEILGYLQGHWQEDFRLKTYLYTAIFLTISIFINYYWGLRGQMLDQVPPIFPRIIFFVGFYLFAYLMVAVPKCYWEHKKSVLQKADFWLSAIVFTGVIGLNSGFSSRFLFEDFRLYEERYVLIKIFENLKSLLLIFVPLWLFWKWKDRKLESFYGLSFHTFKFRPYFFMFLGMIPLITAASFLPDFLETYPFFRLWRLSENAFGLKPIEWLPIYEIFYAWDFVCVELAFRGALVIGMARILGKDAVLPMVAVYAFLHFGKPLGETISSIFGGYLLGIIALHSRHILGGCMIHIGIALLMDSAALVQHYWQGTWKI